MLQKREVSKDVGIEVFYQNKNKKATKKRRMSILCIIDRQNEIKDVEKQQSYISNICSPTIVINGCNESINALLYKA